MEPLETSATLQIESVPAKQGTVARDVTNALVVGLTIRLVYVGTIFVSSRTSA